VSHSEEIRLGSRVKAVRMAPDSFYRQVIGTVTDIRNGYVEIDATEVMSKWDRSFERHPTSCRTSAKLADVVAL
jgi:hypothetical protein